MEVYAPIFFQKLWNIATPLFHKYNLHFKTESDDYVYVNYRQMLLPGEQQINQTKTTQKDDSWLK